jgi:hypothetical protein
MPPTDLLLDLCIVIPSSLFACAILFLTLAPYDRAGRRRYRLED